MADSSSIERDRSEGGGLSRRLLERIRGFELVVGLGLVLAGFAAVTIGWWQASATADVRIQMQALISGGFGGLGMIVLGAAVMQAYVGSQATRELASRFDRVADVLLDLALTEEHQLALSRRNGSSGAGPQLVTKVVASHASYHLADCDLTEGRTGLRELTVLEAEAENLQACGVCLPGVPVTLQRKGVAP